MKFIATKKLSQLNLIFPLLFSVLLNPGLKIRDRKKSGSWIRDKHPGSVTLSPLEGRLCLQCDGIGSSGRTDEDAVGDNFVHFFVYFFI